jgi:nucleoside-diphosphate-sugar epimerase
MTSRVLVTGGTGFVGGALIERLIANGFSPVSAVRKIQIQQLIQYPVMEIGDLNSNIDWSKALYGIKLVAHVAGRAHVMKAQSADSLAEFRSVNVAGTLNLAQQAAVAGVKRFIFVSSIKVNGEQTKTGHSFTEKDTPNPIDPYGISKHEAEEGLRLIAKETGMEVVIIRPVLVYGPGVKGNFQSMIRWLHKGIPLPFATINNARSFVALDNLVDLIITCLNHPAAANQTFLVSDGEDLSTTEFLKNTASAMGVRCRLLPVPALIIQAGAKLLGQTEIAQRLCSNLQVDISKARQLLGWVPPISVEDGLRKAVENYEK